MSRENRLNEVKAKIDEINEIVVSLMRETDNSAELMVMMQFVESISPLGHQIEMLNDNDLSKKLGLSEEDEIDSPDDMSIVLPEGVTIETHNVDE